MKIITNYYCYHCSRGKFYLKLPFHLKESLVMMSDVLYNTGCSIYPGDYVPLLSPEEIDKELIHSREKETLSPPVNITELPDTYKVEVAIPGVRREDFSIHSKNNILSIRVLHKESGSKEVKHFQLREFNYDCFNRQINLPANADVEFLSAEYKGGILQMMMPKTKHPGDKSLSRIVVY